MTVELYAILNTLWDVYKWILIIYYAAINVSYCVGKIQWQIPYSTHFVFFLPQRKFLVQASVREQVRVFVICCVVMRDCVCVGCVSAIAC